MYEGRINATERSGFRDCVGDDGEPQIGVARPIVRHDTHVVRKPSERAELAVNNACMADEQGRLVGAPQPAGATTGKNGRGNLQSHVRTYHCMDLVASAAAEVQE